MYKFKIVLLLLFLPISYFVYHVIGFDNGINAYIEKSKTLEEKENYKYELIKQISIFKRKIALLKDDNIDLDYLEEKSFEVLGNEKTNSYTIILN